jgi:D-arabinitol dehydrogenase (NADP+)
MSTVSTEKTEKTGKKMRAALIEAKERLRIVEADMPHPVLNEVLIEVFASGICGTDLHIYKGDYKGTYPIIPGHEFSGIVRAVGPDVRSFKPGDRVAVEPNISCGICYECLNNRQHYCENVQSVGVTRPGAMAQFMTAPEGAVFDIGDLSFEEASFMEPLSCVLHGVERFRLELADRVLLIGAGPIGLLLLQSLLLTGCSRVDVADRDPDRLETAKRFGAANTFTNLNDVPREYYHKVCDATGATSVLEQTVDFVRSSGTVLWFGVPNVQAEVRVSPFTLFAREITILSTYTSLRNSWQALYLLQEGRIKVKELISHRLPLDEFEKGLKILETHSEPAMKILIMPQEQK